MMTKLREAYSEQNSPNSSASLHHLVEETFDGIKYAVLDALPPPLAEELSNEDSNSSRFSSGASTGSQGSIRQSKTCNTDGPPNWDDIELDSVQSGVEIASEAEVAVAADDKGPNMAVEVDDEDEEDPVPDFLERIGRRVKSFFQWLWQAIKSFAAAVKDAIIKAYSKIMSFLEGAQRSTSHGTYRPLSTAPFSKCHLG